MLPNATPSSSPKMWNDDYYDLCASEEFGLGLGPVGTQQGSAGSTTSSVVTVSRNYSMDITEINRIFRNKSNSDEI